MIPIRSREQHNKTAVASAPNESHTIIHCTECQNLYAYLAGGQVSTDVSNVERLPLPSTGEFGNMLSSCFCFSETW